MNLIGLALRIIKLYPKLVNSMNKEGLSPLQILAGKPNCFKSSTRMEFLQSIIYNCKNVTFILQGFSNFNTIIRSKSRHRICHWVGSKEHSYDLII